MKRINLSDGEYQHILNVLWKSASQTITQLTAALKESTATTMYGSSNGIKNRIILIAKNKKMKATTLIAVLLIAILAVGCTFTAAPNNVEGLSNGDKKDKNAWNMTEILENPVSASIHQLNLVGAKVAGSY